MKTSKLIVGTLVITILMFLMDWLFYGIIWPSISGTENPDFMREAPLFMWLVIGMLIFSFMFTYMYPKGIEGGNSVGQGVKYGVLVAFLVFVPMALIRYSLEDFAPLQDWIIDAVYRIVQLGVIGAILALIVGIVGDRGKRNLGGGE